MRSMAERAKLRQVSHTRRCPAWIEEIMEVFPPPAVKLGTVTRNRNERICI